MGFNEGCVVRCINSGGSRVLVVGQLYRFHRYTSEAKDFIQLREVLAKHPNHSYHAEHFALASPVPADQGGRKDDSGKLAMNLLDDMPNALAAVVEVMQWAVTDKKPVPYERGSWQGVHADRYREAIKRHDQAACAQAVEFLIPGQYRDAGLNEARFQRDHETNLLHLAHIATSALMALENTIRELKGKQ